MFIPIGLEVAYTALPVYSGNIFFGDFYGAKKQIVIVAVFLGYDRR